MKYFLLLTLLLTVFNQSYSQSVCPDYYEDIWLAEDYIMEEEYEKAIEEYKQIFNDCDKFIFKDVHNALLAAASEDDVESFEVFAKKVEGYVDPDYYTSSIYESLDEKYKTILSIYCKQQFEPAYCALMDKLNILDQSLRKACGYKNTGSNCYAYCGEEIKLLDSAILKQFWDYVDENGFPEQKDGCSAVLTSLPYCTMLNHSLQWNYSVWLDRMPDYIDSMYIHPQLYAAMMDYHWNNNERIPENDFGLSHHLIINKKLYIIDSYEGADSTYIVLNKNRKAVHLPPVKQYFKRIAYQFFTNTDFLLIYPDLMPRLNVPKSVVKRDFKDILEFEVKSFDFLHEYFQEK